MDARGGALDPALGTARGERGDEPVAALGVGAADAAQVAVVLARRDQVRERELVERGGAVVGGELLRRQRGRERGAARAIQPSRSAGASVLDAVPT